MTATFAVLFASLVTGGLPDVETLRRQLQAADPAQRLAVFDLFVLESLTGEVKVPTEVLPDLVPLLDDADRRVRGAATAFWTKQGQRGLPALLAATEDARPTYRRPSALFLATIHGTLKAEDARRVIQQLERLLFDPDRLTRAAAEAALARLHALP